ncbi:acetate permease actP [Vibrio sp. JCM 19236]|nr:acetate permease actP [Vibrio sp. JCM 19236]
MDLKTITYLVVGATFALYIGIAIWLVLAQPRNSMLQAEV